MVEKYFNILVSPSIADNLSGEIEKITYNTNKNCVSYSKNTELPIVKIRQEGVSGFSVEALTGLVVAVGGGVGLAAIITSIAKAIVSIRDKKPNGEIKLNTDGRIIEMRGYSVDEITVLLKDTISESGEAKKELVHAFGGPVDRLIDQLYDPITGNYFEPGLGEKRFKINKPVEYSRQLTAILDTGIMTHHPWIKGRIKKYNDFTGEGIEDLNGHGTMVALQYLNGWGQSSGNLDSCWLMIVKVLDKNKIGSEENLKTGLIWAAENGATSINLSLGIYRKNGCAVDCELCCLIEQLNRKRIIVTLAAGNDPNKISCPQARGSLTMKIGSANSDGAVKKYTGPGASMVSSEPLGLRKVTIETETDDNSVKRYPN